MSGDNWNPSLVPQQSQPNITGSESGNDHEKVKHALDTIPSARELHDTFLREIDELFQLASAYTQKQETATEKDDPPRISPEGDPDDKYGITLRFGLKHLTLVKESDGSIRIQENDYGGHGFMRTMVIADDEVTLNVKEVPQVFIVPRQQKPRGMYGNKWDSNYMETIAAMILEDFNGHKPKKD